LAKEAFLDLTRIHQVAQNRKIRHMFSNRVKFIVFKSKYASYGQENVRKWTLLEGKTQGGWIGSTVNMKGTPVMGIDHSGPGSCRTCSPQNSLLRRRPSLHERVRVPIPAQIVEFQHTYFGKLQNVLRSLGFGIKRARKCTLMDAFGWPIVCRMGWYWWKVKGRAVLR